MSGHPEENHTTELQTWRWRLNRLLTNVRVNGPLVVEHQALCANSDLGPHPIQQDFSSCCWCWQLVDWRGLQLHSDPQCQQQTSRNCLTLPRTTLQIAKRVKTTTDNWFYNSATQTNSASNAQHSWVQYQYLQLSIDNPRQLSCKWCVCTTKIS